ncbi:methionyl-tRNA formyltransferase [Flagellimonas halotolerans]|uniref:Methionyl-tRNA formyltransferase n=1 Tax=Flagellimonas halotolerans TaxID=3112164 RepID=A0ABU6ILI3_9FLAO|nr:MULTISPECIES: methionyl-tRNA formyltransferase [unclassified Allomuricauda]MEC3963970.1 methionyl-tRNA formyltransferase [Muricauda sp. SYSU M86414]MEC4263840.1 methionyl-tRNA formyltransferase [Muricauda sp. SYSU M84420]
MRLGLLISGGLGRIALSQLQRSHQLIFVMTDKRSSEIINVCEKSGIRTYTGNPRRGNCSEFIRNVDIDVLISVNYLFLIEADLINLPKKCAFNIHGSLLPKYRGRTPHVWAIINDEKWTGITAHVIDEGCDTGDILEQHRIRIEPNDTGTTILEKYAKAYPVLLNSVLESISKNNLKPKPQKVEEGTYFGKRTPEDGLINWDWHRKRIHNWIRAQSPPYPGAFSIVNQTRIVFESSAYSNLGFHYETKNGTILSVSPLIVKTPNGALELHLHQKSDAQILKVNQQFE